MIFKCSFWIAGLLMVLGFTNLRGSVITWTNVNGGAWSAPLNWDLHVVPGSNDFANITVAGTYTVTADVNLNVYSLTLGGASGQQTLTNNAQTLAITNTLITANGIFGLGGGTLNGGALTNQGTFQWGGGSVTIPVTIAEAGTMSLNGSAVNLYSPLTNEGTIHFIGANSSITLNNNHMAYTGVIDNQPGALFDIQNNQAIYCGCYGFETFQNAGTLRKSAGVETTSFNVVFTNASTGTVDAESGTIQFANGGNIGGTYNTAASGIIQFVSGNFIETGTTTNTGTGLFRQNNASVTLNERITKFILYAGNVSLSPTFQGTGAIQNLQLDGAYLTGTNTVTGTLGIDGGGINSASPLTVTAAGVLDFNGAAVSIYAPVTNAGTVNWSGSSVTINNNHAAYTGVFYNQPGAFLYLESDQSFGSGDYGFESFINAGTIQKIAGLGISTFSLVFTNNGTVDAESGAIHFTAGGNLGGTYHTASGAIIEFDSGSYTQSGAPNITGSGLCRQYNATVTLNDQIPNFLLNAGYVALSPTFQTNGAIHNLQLDGAYLIGTNTVTGTLGIDGGGINTASPLTVAPSGVLNFNGAAVNLYAPLTNNGIINWSGSTVTVNNNNAAYTGVFYNQAGAYLYLQSDQSLSSGDYGFESFSNAGIVRKTAGLGISTIALPCTNTGTVDAQSGMIHFTGGGNIGGTYNTASGSIIEFDTGNFIQTGAPNVSGSGLCRQNNATVTLIDRIPNFLHIAGYVILSPTFQGDGTIHNLQLDGAYLDGTNIVTGTLGLDGGGNNTASPLTISASGVLNFNGAAVSLYAPLTNSGIINWSGSTVTINNNGLAYTCNIYNQPGGLFNFQSDQSLNSGGYGAETFFNTGTIRKTAGLGMTTINVPFHNSGGLDVQSGTIRIAGFYAQSGGTMNFGITSLADYGKISYVASTPITSVLSVNFNGGYFPSPGDSFALLTYPSLSGAFTGVSLPPQATWQTNYSATTFTLSVLTVVGGGLPVILTPVSLAAGRFTIQVNGGAGPSYILQGSTDLINWTSIATNKPTVLPYDVIDPNAGNFNDRFYRILLGP
jgi:hypothetical protein